MESDSEDDKPAIDKDKKTRRQDRKDEDQGQRKSQSFRKRKRHPSSSHMAPLVREKVKRQSHSGLMSNDGFALFTQPDKNGCLGECCYSSANFCEHNKPIEKENRPFSYSSFYQHR